MLGQSVFKFENRLTNSVEIVKKSSFIKYNNVKNYKHHGANNRIILN